MMQVITYTKRGLAVSDTIPKTLAGKKVWIHLTDPTEREFFALQQTYDIHPLTIEDMVHQTARLKIETFKKYTFCVFSQIKQTNHIKFTPMYYLIGKKFLITYTQEPFEPITHTGQKILFEKGMDWLFHRLLDKEVDKYFPILDKIEEQVNKLERDAFNKDDSVSKDIVLLRRKVTSIKHRTLVMQEKISTLIKSQEAYISSGLVPYMRDILDHTYHLTELSESLRDTIRTAYEIYISEVSRQSNDVMKVFSIIATLMLPLTVISGIYGTNFKNLPGMFHPNGFWIMIGGMMVLMLVMIYYFKRKKWF